MKKINFPDRLISEPAIMSGLILPSSFIPLWDMTDHGACGSYWFIFRAGKLLVATGLPNLPGISMSERPPVPVKDRHFIGMLDGIACWAANCNYDIEPPAGFAFEALRALFNRLPDNFIAVAGRGAQVVEFHRTHRHCGVCAATTEIDDGGRARRCLACDEIVYPHIAPAMMVLVKRDTTRGRELLLARGTRFASPIYSALAGFVEPSESIEDCIHRETFEEVGVRVCNLRYFGSQGWPFPHSLMIAFIADHESGDIACEAGEIADAQWFTLANLPELPSRFSIARRLINAAIAEVAPDHPLLCR